MKWLYLLVNVFTILIPFIYSFHPKLKFHKTWKAFFPAMLIVGLFFVLWDALFTSMGVWGFNERYITGIRFMWLPLEEVLFFVCIPYACVFTYHCLTLFMRHRGMKENKWLQKWVTIVLIGVMCVAAVLYANRWYSVTTFALLAVLLFYLQFVERVKWLNAFYLIYAVLLIPFVIVNGILTGTGIEEEVVWYNAAEHMGYRIGTIPVEDVFYGMALILMNVALYKFLLKKQMRETELKIKKHEQISVA
ncbi:MAG TPA: lycopene cyclase domain-containing protein [Ferruginibacter sp.]|nr:lycopene cyclase domain-containing protein [Ferruginibacter sp.]HRO18198.1 lycopene cyclase domain-containing protein [Ferruginibacter sp.]HRQ20499.1 lycopene cyclase domain-containing protein [Ferruginibacter sp.]